MFKKRVQKSMDTTTTTDNTITNTTTGTAATTATLKSKRFPTMFKKIMLSRLKNISKDATSVVKSSVQKKTSAKKKSAAVVAASTEGAKLESESVAVKSSKQRPGTATLDKLQPVDDGSGQEVRPQPQRTVANKRSSAAAVGQHFNNRTYRVKTKDRKSVLSLPEVSKQQKYRKSYLPVKVKSPAPAPPIPQRQQKTSPNDRENNKENDRENVTAVKNEKAPEGYQPENWVPTAVGSARKKRLVLCYLCGKEFGTASLPFHEPQCLKKWTLENSKLPEHLQRTMPQKPEAQNITIDDWNQLAWEATQSNLVPCDYCQRKFLANRLEAHTKVCIESKKKISATPKLSAAKSTAMDNKPKKKPAPCYVCGRLFGSASIGIHEPQCLVKWTRENDRLAPHLRRTVPTKPEAIVDEATGNVDLKAT